MPEVEVGVELQVLLVVVELGPFADDVFEFEELHVDSKEVAVVFSDYDLLAFGFFVLAPFCDEASQVYGEGLPLKTFPLKRCHLRQLTDLHWCQHFIEMGAVVIQANRRNRHLIATSSAIYRIDVAVSLNFVSFVHLFFKFDQFAVHVIDYLELFLLQWLAQLQVKAALEVVVEVLVALAVHGLEHPFDLDVIYRHDGRFDELEPLLIAILLLFILSSFNFHELVADVSFEWLDEDE